MKKSFKNPAKYLEAFLARESSGGIILAASTVIALVLANSQLADNYFHLLHLKFAGLSVQHWINDGLMTIFFFVVGMEIKKELLIGELSSPKRAALPMLGAVGGVLVPSLIYFALNPEYPNVRGWAIPMATDIAFAVGVLSFFGKRVPLALKVFLLALAIVDDLIAVTVIAFFYTKEISGPALGGAAIVFGGMILLKSVGVRSYAVYTILGAVAWFAILQSGVHATVAGVVIGLLTPLSYPKVKAGTETYSPLEELTHLIHPWVAFGIMPIFALANAGVTIDLGNPGELINHPIHQGVVLGLFLGKPIGISLTCLLAVSLKLASLPQGVRWLEIIGVSSLAGIGFTMALFISGLSLYPDQEVYSKTGILLGSLLSMIGGGLLLKFAFSRTNARMAK